MGILSQENYIDFSYVIVLSSANINTKMYFVYIHIS